MILCYDQMWLCISIHAISPVKLYILLLTGPFKTSGNHLLLLTSAHSINKQNCFAYTYNTKRMGSKLKHLPSLAIFKIESSKCVQNKSHRIYHKAYVIFSLLQNERKNK